MNIYGEFLIKMQAHQLYEFRDDSFGAHSVSREESCAEKHNSNLNTRHLLIYR